MTRDELKSLLADLRSMNVQEAHFHSGELAFVQFFMPQPPPRVQSDEEPAVGLERESRKARMRSLDSRLFDPLGIGDSGQPKPGGEE